MTEADDIHVLFSENFFPHLLLTLLSGPRQAKSCLRTYVKYPDLDQCAYHTRSSRPLLSVDVEHT